MTEGGVPWNRGGEQRADLLQLPHLYRLYRDRASIAALEDFINRVVREHA